jgi:hypothetical protein
VRKFFCRNPDCARKIFTERLSWPHHGSGSLLIPLGEVSGKRRLVLSPRPHIGHHSRGFNHPRHPRLIP